MFYQGHLPQPAPSVKTLRVYTIDIYTTPHLRHPTAAEPAKKTLGNSDGPLILNLDCH